MLLQAYTSEELKFAWCFRVYFGFQTHRRKLNQQLALLDRAVVNTLLEPCNIHLLEFSSDPKGSRILVSLPPKESVSTAASKIKGRLSKCLSNRSAHERPAKQLARGYFALTTGRPTTNEVTNYLEHQCEHHGYAERVRPPVFVKSYHYSPETCQWLAAEHAVTRIRFHIVLATQWRKGVFSEASASAVAGQWQKIQRPLRISIAKVSFVPDHVHIAVELHPGVSPAQVVNELMNVAQDFLWEHFEESVIRSKVSRLWQSSAYVGSFGDLSSGAVAAYVKRWEKCNGNRNDPPDEPGAFA